MDTRAYRIDHGFPQPDATRPTLDRERLEARFAKARAAREHTEAEIEAHRIDRERDYLLLEQDRDHPLYLEIEHDRAHAEALQLQRDLAAAYDEAHAEALEIEIHREIGRRMSKALNAIGA